MNFKSISADELLNWKNNSKDFRLIDVREKWEFEIFNIGGENIPMNEFLISLPKIDSSKPAIFICEKGIRSSLVLQRLNEINYPNADFYNLSGGLKSWKESMLG